MKDEISSVIFVLLNFSTIIFQAYVSILLYVAKSLNAVPAAYLNYTS